MRLQDLYAEYSDRVQFLVIYIREAHPTDGWYMGNHDIRDPQTIKERRALAGTCETRLKYGIPTIVDEMDDGVMKAGLTSSFGGSCADVAKNIVPL